MNQSPISPLLGSWKFRVRACPFPPEDGLRRRLKGCFLKLALMPQWDQNWKTAFPAAFAILQLNSNRLSWYLTENKQNILLAYSCKTMLLIVLDQAAQRPLDLANSPSSAMT